ncbi:MAG: hypothetical protein MI975_00405 [Cytophagales bacterium]|nr:hypothetical protein [Cytophagales bacterium]
MSKKKKSWLGGELTYLFLAPFLVLLGILFYGILFDKWYKDPLLILEYSAIAYGTILILRVLGWAIRALSR